MKIFVSGASGCIGRALVPFLRARGHSVRCGRRRPQGHGDVLFDLDDDDTIAPALAGVDAAVYLVHGLDRGHGYDSWEARVAEAFGRAAAAGGARRIVYLGGVMPPASSSGTASSVSTHLQSRHVSAQALRAGAGDNVGVVELRAGMIVAPGSASFMMARDVAARMPVLLRPPWLKTKQRPVARIDVVAAIYHALVSVRVPDAWGCKGPQSLGGDEVILTIASLMGLRPPVVDIPDLGHRVAARLMAGLSRAERAVVQELVLGMQGNLEGNDDDDIFDAMPDHQRTPFATAAALAIRDEDRSVPSTTWMLERGLQVLPRSLARLLGTSTGKPT
jgi:uncharacterized protein YbjT (DUF2867 family)